MGLKCLFAHTSDLEQEETQPLLYFTSKETQAQGREETPLWPSDPEGVRAESRLQNSWPHSLSLHAPSHLDLPW